MGWEGFPGGFWGVFFYLRFVFLVLACVLVLSSAAPWLLRFGLVCLSMLNAFSLFAFRSPARSCLSVSGGGPGVPGGSLWCFFAVFFGVGLGAAVLEVLGALGGPKVAPNL